MIQYLLTDIIIKILEYLHPIDLQNYFLAHKSSQRVYAQNKRLTDKKFEEIYYNLPWYYFKDYKKDLIVIGKKTLKKYVKKILEVFGDRQHYWNTQQSFMRKKDREDVIKNFNLHYLKDIDNCGIIIWQVKFINHTPLLDLLKINKYFCWKNYVDNNFFAKKTELKHCFSIKEKDILIVCQQAEMPYEVSLKSLIMNRGDVVDAIMDLQFPSFNK